MFTSSLCSIVVLMIITTSVSGKLMQLKLDAANRMTNLYIDGEHYKGTIYHEDNWKRLTKINVEEDTCLLAMSAECPRHTGCFAGLIFCDDSCRFYSNKPNCVCTKSVEHIEYIWYRPQFKDNSWPSAYEHYPVNSSRSPYKVLSDQLCPDAAWIWTPSIYDEKVYCRCRLRVNGGWSDWSACVDGVQTRECNQPAPSCTGAPCEGESTRNCTQAPPEDCPEHCSSCNSSGDCISCDGGYFLAESKCQECPKHCSECQSEKVCTACENGYELNKNGNKCVPNKSERD